MGFSISRVRTKRGYMLGDVVSAMQKAIRRGDVRLAGYWAIEMFETNYDGYCWNRLLITSAEDCWGIITQETFALFRAYNQLNKGRKRGERRGRIFISKAVVLLCQAKKSRDPDHLQNLLYDAKKIDDDELNADLDLARQDTPAVPEYAYDCHTQRGKSRGKTKRDFFIEEFAALEPREQGVFDELVPPSNPLLF